ncbi:MAG: sugar transferase [Bacteroidetes bacterium]|nr:sugar transferase [Bacteroidota bacterium]
MFKVYKPKLWLILTDLLMIGINVFIVFRFFPLTTHDPFLKYFIPLIVVCVLWLIVSYLLGRYKGVKHVSFLDSAYALFFTSVIILLIFGVFILIQPASPYSQNVLITIILGIFVCIYVFLFVYYVYRYAVQYDAPPQTHEKRLNSEAQPSKPLSEDAEIERRLRITDFSGEKVYSYLKKHINLNESGTCILTELNLQELEKQDYYQYSTYIQLKRLNHIRGINKMLALINTKLSDDGVVVCCYRSQSTLKQMILKKYPAFIAYSIYIVYFLYHRVMSKFFLTKRLYHDLTEGKKRVLSKTEVLGRLNFCGYKVLSQAKINDVNYVIARRVKSSEPLFPRYYGFLIKLRRTGKNGKELNVFKLRTMHPYAEFLQEYIYENNSLQEGGKFKKDIRVTTYGHFLRKYWLDELPMLINLVKGNMKLIGVRPLSYHYFNLYSKELQKKRIKYKPGLLPPFYADMPKTLDEIQASEMKYLNECEERGVFITDIKYFFLILKNILFKKARSA